jgi:hypothetical protein
MAIGTGAYGAGAPSAASGAKYFGGADYGAAISSGHTNIQIFDWLNANLSKLSPGKANQPGGGGLYDQIQARAQTERDVAAQNRQRQGEIARQEEMQRQREAAQAERLRQMEISSRTQAANLSRSGLQSALEIKSSSKSSRTAGTQGFRRRKLQVNPTAYSAVSSGADTNKSKNKNTSKVLNV